MTGDPSVDNAGVRVPPPFVYLAGLMVGYLVEWLWPIPIGPRAWTPVVPIVGLVAAAGGLSVMLTAFALFRRRDTAPEPWRTTTRLVFDGPYRFTRNPMYLGMALIQGGLALVGDAFWPLLTLVPVIFFIRTRVIAREERYLEAKFGGEYRAFKSRVRRWL